VRRGARAAGIAVALLATLVVAYLVALYVSAKSVTFTLERIIPDLSIDVVRTKKLPLDLYFRARSGGPLPIIVKSIYATVYVEGVEAAVVSRSAPLTLNPGEEKIVKMRALIDRASIAYGAGRILEAVRLGEVEVRVDGVATVSSSFLSLDVPLAHASYVLLGEPKPVVRGAAGSARPSG